MIKQPNSTTPFSAQNKGFKLWSPSQFRRYYGKLQTNVIHAVTNVAVSVSKTPQTLKLWLKSPWSFTIFKIFLKIIAIGTFPVWKITSKVFKNRDFGHNSKVFGGSATVIVIASPQSQPQFKTLIIYKHTNLSEPRLHSSMKSFKNKKTHANVNNTTTERNIER